MSTHYYVPGPPDDIFKYRKPGETANPIYKEGKATFFLERIEFDQGIKIWWKGIPHARKGYTTAEALFAANVAKRGLLQMAHIPCLFILPKMMAMYERMVLPVIRWHVLEEEYLIPISKELLKLNLPYKNLPEILAYICEYDNAYRYRLYDMMNETSKRALMKTPRKELHRLIDLYIKRDGNPALQHKVRNLKALSTAFFLLPFSNKIFRGIIKDINIENMKPDEDDRYWLLKELNYDYFGLTLEERQTLINKI